MPAFSKNSRERMATCKEPLQRLFLEVIKYYDCIILCGHRDEAAQNAAFARGASKAKWPNSAHNSWPSRAIDVVPFPIAWPDELGIRRGGVTIGDYTKQWGRFYLFAGYVLATARQMKIPLRSGVDWNGNFELKDDNFQDAPHFELI